MYQLVYRYLLSCLNNRHTNDNNESCPAPHLQMSPKRITIQPQYTMTTTRYTKKLHSYNCRANTTQLHMSMRRHFYYALCRRGCGTSRLQPSVKNVGIFQKKLQLETDGTTVAKDGSEMLSGQFVLVPTHYAWINRKDQGQVHGLFCASA